MAKKGHWSRDRDARRAARESGLKDDEFEVVKGPKGFTYRKKVKYVEVKEAKLHGIEKDLDSDVDKEQMTHTELGGCCSEHPTPNQILGQAKMSTTPPLVLEEAVALGGQHTEVHHIEPEIVENISSLPQALENEMKEEGLDPDKEELQEKPIFSEKEQENIRAGAEASRQAEEYRQTHNERGEKLPPGTFNPGTLPPRVRIPRIHKSTVENPSKLVWEIAEQMTVANPKVRRKEIIEKCVASGIAYYTARTQYQVWLAIKRDSAAHAAQANGETP